MERVDAVVIGAGVIGLAIARSLARTGRSVIILEQDAAFGTGISSRNSEVIHAGIHYPHGSLKESMCIAGKRMLYDYCASRKIPHRRLGKLTIACSESELPRLDQIAEHAALCGADTSLELLDAQQVRQIEPALPCKAALLTPSSGIVDSHALMLSLLGEAQDHGAVLARNCAAIRITQSAGLWQVNVSSLTLSSSIVVNAAGLDAQAMASRIEGLPASFIPPLYLAKGSYFGVSGKTPFSRLIYPLPIVGGLGVHLTLDMAGQARFGPDVEWVETRGYAVDPGGQADFLSAARRIWPDIDPARLTPAYAGIRPNLSGPQGPMADFAIEGPQRHGLPGLVNLFGIDSPGLTACLAIAEHVSALLQDS